MLFPVSRQLNHYKGESDAYPEQVRELLEIIEIEDDKIDILLKEQSLEQAHTTIDIELLVIYYNFFQYEETWSISRRYSKVPLQDGSGLSRINMLAVLSIKRAFKP